MSPPYFYSTAYTGNGLALDVPIALPDEWGVKGDHSNILAAVTAISDLGLPEVVTPTSEVTTITPSENSVTVRLNIDWDSPITVRVALVIWP
jgi:hypothetical protein